MPHINKEVDFTVTAYLVYEDTVLLIHHKGLKKWLPVGGHIDPGEDPEEALFREIEEESGLTKKEVDIWGGKPAIEDGDTKFLVAPAYLDIHRIEVIEGVLHRHVGMHYFGRALANKVALAEDEHSNIRWFLREDLEKPEYNLTPAVKFYASEALKRLGSTHA